MKSRTFPRLIIGLAALFAIRGFAQDQPDESTAKPIEAAGRVQQMNPFTVSALYAAVEVEFTLSGKDLFNPLADTIESAQIVAVQIRDPDDTPEIKIGDTIESIAGTPLRGLTIPEVAALLSKAREAGVPEWRISSPLTPAKTIKFDGDWLVPMPGLKR